MYNDKIGYSEGLRRREAMTLQKRNQPSCAYSDRPVAALSEDIPQLESESRRLCDGTLRTPTQNGGCMSGTGWGLKEHPLGMVYSPYQYFRQIYSPETALTRGTVFTELDLPFEGYKR